MLCNCIIFDEPLNCNKSEYNMNYALNWVTFLINMILYGNVYYVAITWTEL